MNMIIVSRCPTFRHLPKLQECLQSNDVNYRIAVGETIALLVELGRDIDEVSRSQTVAVADRRMWCKVHPFHAAVRGGGQWKPVSVSEESGHRRQQASSQERQAEAALHFQRGSALYRGGLKGLDGWHIFDRSFGLFETSTHLLNLNLFPLFSCRTRTLRRRPSSLEWRASISTAGWGEESMTPSKRSWSLEWDITCRSDMCCGLMALNSWILDHRLFSMIFT